MKCDISFLFKIFLLIIFSSILNILNAGNLINVNSIKIAKDYPASFVLDLKSFDVVSVQYDKIDGNVDLSQIEVRVIDMNLQEEVVKDILTPGSGTFSVDYEGYYRVEFVYTGSGRFRVKERYINLTIQIDLDGFNGLDKGESMKVLHMNNCVIEESEENAFELLYFLEKDDKVTISSTDSKSSFLKLRITQLPTQYALSRQVTVPIPRDGWYSFNFYLEAEDNQSFFRELLDNDNYLFTDLVISIDRINEVFNLPNAGGNQIGSQNSADGTEEEAEPENDFESLLEQIQKGNADMVDQNLEAQNKTNELMKLFIEQLNKKEYYVEVSPFMKDIQELTLEPEFNFSESSSNRVCVPIQFQPSETGLWIYWVGVGSNPKKAFEEHNAEFTRMNNQNRFDQVAAEYAYARNFKNDNLGKIRPTYPDEQIYSKYLNEDAEYAIVDAANRTKFLNGQDYSRLNYPENRAKYITSDHGSGLIPSPDQDTFFCACNNNKATPVKIYFRYITILAKEIER